jgi:hypothetical protein
MGEGAAGDDERRAAGGMGSHRLGRTRAAIEERSMDVDKAGRLVQVASFRRRARAVSPGTVITPARWHAERDGMDGRRRCNSTRHCAIVLGRSETADDLRAP